MSLPDQRVRGGPPSHLYLLRDALVARGADVRGFTYGARTSDESRFTKIIGRLRDIVRFPFRLLQHRPDVVHLNSAFDRKGVFRDAFFVAIARVLGFTVVIKCHGSDLEFLKNATGRWRLLQSVVVRGSNLVCVLSAEEKATFEEHYPTGRFEMVKNALDFSRYQRESHFRERYGIPADKPLLLFIARFIREKGLHEVLKALPSIREKHDVHVALVGDGPVRQECEDLGQKLGVAEHLTLTGYIPEDETVDAYLASDLLVFPTYHQEGMPMVLFHSMACRLPIITTRTRAAADWLSDHESVLFVPPRDATSLAGAVTRLLDDPTLRGRMGQEGRRIAEGFGKDAVAEHFLSLYSGLTSTSTDSAEPAARHQ